MENSGAPISMVFTYEQLESVCKHFGKDIRELQDFEVNEQLDKLIDIMICSD